MAITIGPEQKTKLVTLINEGAKVMQEMDDLKAGLNDTVKHIAQELDIKPTILSKAIRVAYKQSFQKEEHAYE